MLNFGEQEGKRFLISDNLPTVAQEKRVVPLLMVWSSRCKGQKEKEANSQGERKSGKVPLFVLMVQSLGEKSLYI